MNSPDNSMNAIALPTEPLFSSSWLALFMVLRAQLGDGRRPAARRRANTRSGSNGS